MAERIIRQYLETPPYLGRSAFADKAYVRQACGSTCCFDEQKKMWGTRQVDCLIQLVRSRKFQPFGIEPAWNTDLVEAAHVYVAEAEAAWKAQQQAAAQKKEAQAATTSGAGAGAGTGGGALKPAPAVAAARREARPVCKAAKKLIAKPNPRNQGKLAFKPAAKPQAA